MPGVLGAVASPRQPASRSRAPLREAWAFLLGVLVQGTAERWGEPLGRVAGHKFSSSTSWGRVRGSPPTPGGTQSQKFPCPHTQNPHCPLKVQAQAREEGDSWPSRQPCATAG